MGLTYYIILGACPENFLDWITLLKRVLLPSELDAFVSIHCKRSCKSPDRDLSLDLWIVECLLPSAQNFCWLCLESGTWSHTAGELSREGCWEKRVRRSIKQYNQQSIRQLIITMLSSDSAVGTYSLKISFVE